MGGSTLPTLFAGVLIPFCVGSPLHPYYNTLASQFEPLDDVLPTECISFALSPSGLIPSPRFSEYSPSPALVQHLRSILPEYVPSDPDPSTDPESNPNTTKAAASNENSGQQPIGGFSLPTIPMPAVGLNVDMRNLKWGWPGYLTFGKNSKDKEKHKNAKAVVDEQKPHSEPEPKPDAGEEGGVSLSAPVAEGDTPGPNPPKGEEKVEVEVEVDTLSLADAIGSESGRGGSSNERSPDAGTPSDTPPSPAARTVGPIDDATPAAVQPPDPVPAFRGGANETPEQPTSTSPPSPSSEEELPPVVSESPPLPVTFSQTLAHLAPSGHPLQTTKRRLYYLTVRRSSVCVPPPGSKLGMCLVGGGRKRTSPSL